MSDIKKENLIWFLDELANAEDYQFENGGLKIVVSDEHGNEGVTTITIQDLAASAIQEITNLVEQNTALNEVINEIRAMVTDVQDGFNITGGDAEILNVINNHWSNQNDNHIWLNS
jgi:hypothetical protein